MKIEKMTFADLMAAYQFVREKQLQIDEMSNMLGLDPRREPRYSDFEKWEAILNDELSTRVKAFESDSE